MPAEVQTCPELGRNGEEVAVATLRGRLPAAGATDAPPLPLLKTAALPDRQGSLTYCGGVVTALAWAPSRALPRVLAVAARGTPRPPAHIQLYRTAPPPGHALRACGLLPVDCVEILDLAWAPAPPNGPARTPLLAAATRSAGVFVFAVPADALGKNPEDAKDVETSARLIQTHCTVCSPGRASPTCVLSWTPDGSMLAMGNTDGAVAGFAISVNESCAVEAEFLWATGCHVGCLTSLAWLDNDRFISAGTDCWIRVRDWRRPSRIIFGYLDSHSLAYKLCPVRLEAEFVIYVTDQGILKVLRDPGKHLGSTPIDQAPTAVAFSLPIQMGSLRAAAVLRLSSVSTARQLSQWEAAPICCAVYAAGNGGIVYEASLRRMPQAVSSSTRRRLSMRDLRVLSAWVPLPCPDLIVAASRRRPAVHRFDYVPVDGSAKKAKGKKPKAAEDGLSRERPSRTAEPNSTRSRADNSSGARDATGDGCTRSTPSDTYSMAPIIEREVTPQGESHGVEQPGTGKGDLPVESEEVAGLSSSLMFASGAAGLRLGEVFQNQASRVAPRLYSDPTCLRGKTYDPRTFCTCLALDPETKLLATGVGAGFVSLVQVNPTSLRNEVPADVPEELSSASKGDDASEPWIAQAVLKAKRTRKKARVRATALERARRKDERLKRVQEQQRMRKALVEQRQKKKEEEEKRLKTEQDLVARRINDALVESMSRKRVNEFRTIRPSEVPVASVGRPDNASRSLMPARQGMSPSQGPPVVELPKVSSGPSVLIPWVSRDAEFSYGKMQRFLVQVQKTFERIISRKKFRLLVSPSGNQVACACAGHLSSIRQRLIDNNVYRGVSEIVSDIRNLFTLAEGKTEASRVVHRQIVVFVFEFESALRGDQALELSRPEPSSEHMPQSERAGTETAPGGIPTIEERRWNNRDALFLASEVYDLISQLKQFFCRVLKRKNLATLTADECGPAEAFCATMLRALQRRLSGEHAYSGVSEVVADVQLILANLLSSPHGKSEVVPLVDALVTEFADQARKLEDRMLDRRQQAVAPKSRKPMKVGRSKSVNVPKPRRRARKETNTPEVRAARLEPGEDATGGVLARNVDAQREEPVEELQKSEGLRQERRERAEGVKMRKKKGKPPSQALSVGSEPVAVDEAVQTSRQACKKQALKKTIGAKRARPGSESRKCAALSRSSAKRQRTPLSSGAKQSDDGGAKDVPHGTTRAESIPAREHVLAESEVVPSETVLIDDVLFTSNATSLERCPEATELLPDSSSAAMDASTRRLPVEHSTDHGPVLGAKIGRPIEFDDAEACEPKVLSGLRGVQGNGAAEEEAAASRELDDEILRVTTTSPSRGRVRKRRLKSEFRKDGNKDNRSYVVKHGVDDLDEDIPLLQLFKAGRFVAGGRKSSGIVKARGRSTLSKKAISSPAKRRGKTKIAAVTCKKNAAGSNTKEPVSTGTDGGARGPPLPKPGAQAASVGTRSDHLAVGNEPAVVDPPRMASGAPEQAVSAVALHGRTARPLEARSKLDPIKASAAGSIPRRTEGEAEGAPQPPMPKPAADTVASGSTVPRGGSTGISGDAVGADTSAAPGCAGSDGSPGRSGAAVAASEATADVDERGTRSAGDAKRRQKRRASCASAVRDNARTGAEVTSATATPGAEVTSATATLGAEVTSATATPGAGDAMALRRSGRTRRTPERLCD